jgi:putative SOS response-associated peptidase YedK
MRIAGPIATLVPCSTSTIVHGMCGRFSQNYTWSELAELYALTQPPRNLAPRYNIAPTTMIDVVRVHDGARELVPMRWGLIPAWWKKAAKEVPATFNARAERVVLSGQSGRGLSGQLVPSIV